MFLRESLGEEKFLRHQWSVWNDGLGEDRYPSSHKDGWPYRANKKVPAPNVTKLELKSR